MTSWKDVIQWCMTSAAIVVGLGLLSTGIASCEADRSKSRDLCIREGGLWTGAESMCVPGCK